MINNETGASDLRMLAKEEVWKAVSERTKVVRLTWAIRAVVPVIFLSTLPMSTRAVSYEGGKFGFTVGALLTAGSIGVGWILYTADGIVGLALTFWAIGSSGLAMMASAARPIAFVKPICTRCRLLPVIKEHEAIHMAGVEADGEVWASMRKRHSCGSLGLKTGTQVCSFCPIPKRLEEG
jgi:hypothetical protein